MVDGAGAELAVELLGSEPPEVVYGEGPEVEHVVPGEGVSLLDHHHLAAQQRQLDGRPQAARAAADDQTLNGHKGGGRGEVLRVSNRTVKANFYLFHLDPVQACKHKNLHSLFIHSRS